MQEGKLHLSEGLCADVGNIVSRGNGAEPNRAIGHTLMHKVVVNINVLGVAVDNGFFASNCTP